MTPPPTGRLRCQGTPSSPPPTCCRRWRARGPEGQRAITGQHAILDRCNLDCGAGKRSVSCSEFAFGRDPVMLSAMTVCRKNHPDRKGQSEKARGKGQNAPNTPDKIIPPGPAKLPSSLLPLVLVISWFRAPKAFPPSGHCSASLSPQVAHARVLVTTTAGLAILARPERPSNPALGDEPGTRHFFHLPRAGHRGLATVIVRRLTPDNQRPAARG